MNEAVLLALLAVLDAIFAGFRASAGRDARLYKVDYYLRGSWLGGGFGIIAISIAALPVIITLLIAPDPSLLFAEYLRVARHLLWFFASYAALVVLAMALWTYPHPGVRTLASVLILGPLTLLRPAIIITACAVAVLLETQWKLRIPCIFAILVQLGIEPTLNWIHSKAQQKRHLRVLAGGGLDG